MKTIIDLGTGDGRFVYKMAKENPNNEYVGIDPMLSQTKKYARKINREKLENVKLIEASVEKLPTNLNNTADELYINFPWGSLLAAIAKPDKNLIRNIIKLLKPKGVLKIVLGYAEEAEPSETQRLELEKLDENRIIQTFEELGTDLVTSHKVEKSEMHKIESSWGKKLTFGQDRKILSLEFIKTSC